MVPMNAGKKLANMMRSFIPKRTLAVLKDRDEVAKKMAKQMAEYHQKRQKTMKIGRK